jgi:pimeloyl-ACP methyl ester carboxylesterase
LPIDAVEFEIAVSAAILDDLQRRLRATRWPAEPASDQAWQWGPPVAYARRVVEYWTTAYDWRSSEREINSFCNYVATLESLDVHFILERGSGSDPRPLIITHGWPGSIVEFLGVIERLAHPERFGGDVGDAFTVVCPSIPGYGFSGAPSRPITPRDVARMWNMLMTEKLGFDTYFAQGGDWGGIVTSWMAYDYPDRLEAIHLNLFAFDQGGSSVGLAGPITGELSDVERDWRRRMAARRDPESGYRTQQGTKPQALAFGLTDSPVGLGMWILEKFHAWTIPGEDRDPPFNLDHLLANVMLYWLAGPAAASWLYISLLDHETRSLPRGERVRVPTAFLFCPNDLMPPPPDEIVRRTYDVFHRTDAERGGHFVAFEQPNLFVADVQTALRGH